MKLPPDLKYTESHEWIRWENDGSATIGITDFAQESLGDLVFIELPQVGRTFKAGENCVVVESVKAASDVYAPFAGEVVAVNQAAADQPDAVNADAFSAWLFRMRPAQAGGGVTLLDATQYANTIPQNK